LGHPAGDQALAALADRVQGTTRSEDIFARYGGEEFALICRDVDSLRAARTAYRIMDTVRSRPFEVDGAKLDLTVSLDVADLGMLVEPTAEALIEAADAALYVAKRNGRNRVEIYDPESEPTRLV